MMEGSFSNPGHFSLDLIEEGRREIFKWRDKRRTQRSGVHGTLYKITKLFITRSLVRSFLHNFSVVVAFQMILAAICTYACVKLGLEIDVHMSLFVSPIVFPLAFSINANYQRRETVLEDLAMFKSASSILFFCHRDWIKAAELPVDLLKTLSNKLKFLVINIREYLLTEDSQKRKFILQAIYEDLSDIAQLNDKIRTSPLKSNSALVARIIHCHNLMCWAFERLRVIREYNSPRSLRAFTKVFIFLMPLLLSPYYVFSGRQTESTWAPYYISVMVSFLFGSLQAVQDKLDDPFDGIGEDDVNLTQLDDWTTQSLLTNRTVTIGRFTVTTTSAQNEHCSNTSPPGHANEQRLHEEGSPKKTRHLIDVGSPTKLRRILSRKNERNNEGRRSMVELDETEFTDQLEARCHGIASKLEGLSGTSIILPGNRVPYVFQEYQGVQSPGGTLSSPEYPTGNTLNVVGAPEKRERKAPSFRLDTRLAVVNESDEEHSPTLEASPVPQSVLFNMKSDAVIRPEEPAKSRPTVLGLFATSPDDRGNIHSPSDERDSTHTKVSDVFTSPDKTDEIASLNRDEVSRTTNPPEELPLLPMNSISSAPTAKVESGSTIERRKTPSSSSEEQLHTHPQGGTTPPRTQGGTSEADSEETDGVPKLRFCLVGKRGARGKSDGVRLWGKRKHKKKRPPSESKVLSESDTELTGTNSMSPLLPDETRTESQCSDTEEQPVFADVHSSHSEKTAGIGYADNAFANRENVETGAADDEAADLRSADSSSTARDTTGLKPMKTYFTDTESEKKYGEVKNPEIVVNSPSEEKNSLWDFDISSDKTSDSNIEKRFSDTRQKEETSNNERVESDRTIPQSITSLRGETSIWDIPSSNNIPTEQGGSRFAVSRNSNDLDSENTRISKPSSENIPTEQEGSRFVVSRNCTDLDYENTRISKPSSDNIPTELEGSRFAVSRNSNDLDSENTRISKPSSENIPTVQGGSRFAVSRNSNDLDSEKTRVSKPCSSRFTISPS